MQALFLCAVIAAAAPNDWTKEMAKEVKEFRHRMELEAKGHLQRASSLLQTDDFSKDFGDFDAVDKKLKELSAAIKQDGGVPSSFIQKSDPNDADNLQKIQDHLKDLTSKLDAQEKEFDAASKTSVEVKPLSFIQISRGIPEEDDPKVYADEKYLNKMPENPDSAEIKSLDHDIDGVLDESTDEAKRFAAQMRYDAKDEDEGEAGTEDEQDDAPSSFAETASRRMHVGEEEYKASQKRVKKATSDLQAIVEQTRVHAKDIQAVAKRTAEAHPIVQHKVPSSFVQTVGVAAAAHHMSKEVESFRAQMEARSTALLEKARGYGLKVSDEQIAQAIKNRRTRRLAPSSFVESSARAQANVDNNPALQQIDARLESLQAQLHTNAMRFEREAQNNIFVEKADRAAPSSFIQAEASESSLASAASRASAAESAADMNEFRAQLDDIRDETPLSPFSLIQESETNGLIANQAVDKVGQKLNTLQQRLAQESVAFDKEAEQTPFKSVLETPSLLQTTPENDAFADLDSVQASLKDIQARLATNTQKFDEQAKQTQMVEAAPSFVQISAIENGPNFHKDDFDLSKISSLAQRIDTELSKAPKVSAPEMSSFLQEDPDFQGTQRLKEVKAKIEAETKDFEKNAKSWASFDLKSLPSSLVEEDADEDDEPEWEEHEGDVEANLKEGSEKLEGIAKHFRDEANREKDYVSQFKAHNNAADINAKAQAFAEKMEKEAEGPVPTMPPADTSSFLEEEPEHLPGPGWAMAEMLRRGN